MLDTVESIVGTRVGNYEVRSLLGAGAMGEVYLGEHPQIGRKVAIKVLRHGFFAQDDLKRRFMSEARAVNRIQHPNIIQIFDFGTLPDGRLYYTMEHLDGQELMAILEARAPLSLQETAAFLRQIAAALEAAHSVGIVHRDLKPENIFVCDTATGPLIKILDFGIAKVLEPGPDGHARTATGMIMGTPLYMSPEQAAGEQDRISPRSDVYALGVITYQMLSGRCPIEAPSLAQVLTKHITEPPTPLAQVVQGLPPRLYPVIERSLAKAPEDRQQTATQLFQELQAAVEGVPPSTRATAIGHAPHGADATQLAEPALGPGGQITTPGRAPAPSATLAAEAHEALAGPVVVLARPRAPASEPAASASQPAASASTPEPVNRASPPARPATPAPASQPAMEPAAKASLPGIETLTARAEMAAIQRSRRAIPLAIGIGALLVAAVVITWALATRSRSGSEKTPPTNDSPAASHGAPDAAIPRAMVPTARPGHHLVHVEAGSPHVRVETRIAGRFLHVKAPPFHIEVPSGQRVLLKASRQGFDDQIESFPVIRDRIVIFLFRKPATVGGRISHAGRPGRPARSKTTPRRPPKRRDPAANHPRRPPPSRPSRRPDTMYGEGTAPIMF